jgi:hypothetical protein
MTVVVTGAARRYRIACYLSKFIVCEKSPLIRYLKTRD